MMNGYDMNKIFYVGIFLGLVAGISFGPQFVDAIYSIPPTNAWQTIFINSNATYSSTGDTNITAISYKDELYLLSDGSIGFNITTYP